MKTSTKIPARFNRYYWIQRSTVSTRPTLEIALLARAAVSGEPILKRIGTPEHVYLNALPSYVTIRFGPCVSRPK